MESSDHVGRCVGLAIESRGLLLSIRDHFDPSSSPFARDGSTSSATSELLVTFAGSSKNARFAATATSIRSARRAAKSFSIPARSAQRAAPHRRQDRGTLLRPRCRGRRPGAGASQPEAVSSRRPQGGGRGQAHRGLAGAAPRHRTRLRPPRTHPHRTPPPVGERPTRQVRPGGQAAAEGVAGEVSRPSVPRATERCRTCQRGWCCGKRVTSQPTDAEYGSSAKTSSATQQACPVLRMGNMSGRAT